MCIRDRDMTAVELGKKIKSGEVTSVEATKAVLDEIKKKDGDINAYITVIEEAALARAEEVQKGIEAVEFADSPLAGVPVSIKGNISTKGIKTSCASKTVSYTHLFIKVAYEMSEEFDAPVLFRLSTRVAHSQSIVAVSYTHLDVYKRQILAAV